MKDPQKQRIRELGKKLKAAELKLKVYDKLIEITNRKLDTDIIKKNRGQVVRELATEKEVSITSVSCQLGYSKQAYYKSKTNQQKKNCYHTMAKQKVLAVRKQLPRPGSRKLYHLLTGEGDYL